jgi:hypothetical protein
MTAPITQHHNVQGILKVVRQRISSPLRLPVFFALLLSLVLSVGSGQAAKIVHYDKGIWAVTSSPIRQAIPWE